MPKIYLKDISLLLRMGLGVDRPAGCLGMSNIAALGTRRWAVGRARPVAARSSVSGSHYTRRVKRF